MTKPEANIQGIFFNFTPKTEGELRKIWMSKGTEGIKEEIERIKRERNIVLGRDVAGYGRLTTLTEEARQKGTETLKDLDKEIEE